VGEGNNGSKSWRLKIEKILHELGVRIVAEASHSRRFQNGELDSFTDFAVADLRQGICVSFVCAEHAGLIIIIFSGPQIRMSQDSGDDPHFCGRLLGNERGGEVAKEVRIDRSADEPLCNRGYAVVNRIIHHGSCPDRNPES